MKNSKSLKSLYAAAATDEQRREVLAAIEPTPSREQIDLLTDVAKNPREYDLARIEAVKVLGLIAADSPENQHAIAETLVKLATEDEDKDVQNYSLQSLAWLTALPWIPSKIEGLLAPSVFVLVRYAAFSVLSSQKENPDARRILLGLRTDEVLGKSARRVLGEG